MLNRGSKKSWQRKKVNEHKGKRRFRALGRIRTCDTRFRKPALYSGLWTPEIANEHRVFRSARSGAQFLAGAEKSEAPWRTIRPGPQLSFVRVQLIRVALRWRLEMPGCRRELRGGRGADWPGYAVEMNRLIEINMAASGAVG